MSIIKFEDSGIELKVDYETILIGFGKFLDNEDGITYDIALIVMPMGANGKHIAVWSKDENRNNEMNITEWRSYDDGKILSFQCDKIEYWESK